MKTLLELSLAVPGALPVGDATVSGVEYDSRQVSRGTLFVAVPGEKFDGHDFVAAAIASGAAAVVVERESVVPSGFPHLVVHDARAAMALLASDFYGNPTKELYLAGVTGTNGKTTTTKMIDAIARAAGDITGTIGTLGATVGDTALPGERTTPESVDLQKLFCAMLENEAWSAAMEVASHALVLKRTLGCAFDVGVFTNLTQDHLDFHQTMDAYEAAKGMLFREYPAIAREADKMFTAVLNTDDAAGSRYAKSNTADRVLTYSPSGDANADIWPSDVVLKVDQITFTANTPLGAIPITLGFGGTFQVANALAAIGYGVARGLAPEVIAEGLAACPPVMGRFHPVKAGQDFAVIVDYAHTPDGVENVLKAARPLTQGRLIAVFGCGGNRDKTKRPIMGHLAKELADIAIVTSDNPRKEDPEAILDDVLAGMTGDGAETYREVDRRTAISLAISLATAGDTIVIAGKGHEDYQILGETKIHFSDLEVAAEEIEKCRLA